MKKLKDLNVEKIARAIEADAGEPLEGLRESLAEAKAGLFAAVLAALRASGDGWQTRVNDTLRASLHLAGRV